MGKIDFSNKWVRLWAVFSIVWIIFVRIAIMEPLCGDRRYVEPLLTIFKTPSVCFIPHTFENVRDYGREGIESLNHDWAKGYDTKRHHQMYWLFGGPIGAAAIGFGVAWALKVKK